MNEHEHNVSIHIVISDNGDALITKVVDGDPVKHINISPEWNIEITPNEIIISR